MSSEAKAEPDPILELVGKQNAMIREVWEQVGALTKDMANLQAENSELKARQAKLDAHVKAQGSNFQKFLEALARMDDRLDATVLRLEMVETSA